MPALHHRTVRALAPRVNQRTEEAGARENERTELADRSRGYSVSKRRCQRLVINYLRSSDQARKIPASSVSHRLGPPLVTRGKAGSLRQQRARDRTGDWLPPEVDWKQKEATDGPLCVFDSPCKTNKPMWDRKQAALPHDAERRRGEPSSPFFLS